LKNGNDDTHEDFETDQNIDMIQNEDKNKKESNENNNDLNKKEKILQNGYKIIKSILENLKNSYVNK